MSDTTVHPVVPPAESDREVDQSTVNPVIDYNQKQHKIHNKQQDTNITAQDSKIIADEPTSTDMATGNSPSASTIKSPAHPQSISNDMDLSQPNDSNKPPRQPVEQNGDSSTSQSNTNPSPDTSIHSSPVTQQQQQIQLPPDQLAMHLQQQQQQYQLLQQQMLHAQQMQQSHQQQPSPALSHSSNSLNQSRSRSPALSHHALQQQQQQQISPMLHSAPNIHQLTQHQYIQQQLHALQLQYDVQQQQLHITTEQLLAHPIAQLHPAEIQHLANQGDTIAQQLATLLTIHIQQQQLQSQSIDTNIAQQQHSQAYLSQYGSQTVQLMTNNGPANFVMLPITNIQSMSQFPADTVFMQDQHGATYAAIPSQSIQQQQQPVFQSHEQQLQYQQQLIQQQLSYQQHMEQQYNISNSSISNNHSEQQHNMLQQQLLMQQQLLNNSNSSALSFLALTAQQQSSNNTPHTPTQLNLPLDTDTLQQAQQRNDNKKQNNKKSRNTLKSAELITFDTDDHNRIDKKLNKKQRTSRQRNTMEHSISTDKLTKSTSIDGDDVDPDYEVKETTRKTARQLAMQASSRTSQRRNKDDEMNTATNINGTLANTNTMSTPQQLVNPYINPYPAPYSPLRSLPTYGSSLPKRNKLNNVSFINHRRKIGKFSIKLDELDSTKRKYLTTLIAQHKLIYNSAKQSIEINKYFTDIHNDIINTIQLKQCELYKNIQFVDCIVDNHGVINIQFNSNPYIIPVPSDTAIDQYAAYIQQNTIRLPVVVEKLITPELELIQSKQDELRQSLHDNETKLSEYNKLICKQQLKKAKLFDALKMKLIQDANNKAQQAQQDKLLQQEQQRIKYESIKTQLLNNNANTMNTNDKDTTASISTDNDTTMSTDNVFDLSNSPHTPQSTATNTNINVSIPATDMIQSNNSNSSPIGKSITAIHSTMSPSKPIPSSTQQPRYQYMQSNNRYNVNTNVSQSTNPINRYMQSPNNKPITPNNNRSYMQPQSYQRNPMVNTTPQPQPVTPIQSHQSQSHAYNTAPVSPATQRQSSNPQLMPKQNIPDRQDSNGSYNEQPTVSQYSPHQRMSYPAAQSNNYPASPNSHARTPQSTPSRMQYMTTNTQPPNSSLRPMQQSTPPSQHQFGGARQWPHNPNFSNQQYPPPSQFNQPPPPSSMQYDQSINQRAYNTMLGRGRGRGGAFMHR